MTKPSNKTKALAILEFINQHFYISINHCISYLNMKHQTASARLSELHDEGIVQISEGANCSYYKLSKNPEKVKEQRERIKIDGLIKKLEAYGYEVIKKQYISSSKAGHLKKY